MVYQDPGAGGLAYKFVDIGTYTLDDNKKEFDADVPDWLTPTVRAYVAESVFLDKMDKTLHDFGEEVPEARWMFSVGQEYAEMTTGH